MTKQYINFDVEFADVVDDNPNSQFATAKIQAFSSDSNRHDMYCSESVLKETASTIYNKPVLYTYNQRLDDFYTHVEPDKSLIAGFIVPDSAEFVRLDDNRLSLQVIAKIWKRYALKFVELFKRDHNKKVSVEMELYESSKRADGLLDMLSFAYTGICVLSDYITEASPGANIEMVSFAEENAKFEEAVRLEFNRYSNIDFKIPNKIKKIVKDALTVCESNSNYKNSNALSLARHLLKNDVASPDKIRQIANRTPKEIDMEDKSSFDYLTHCLYGSYEGHRWATKLAGLMDEVDSKSIAYFEDTVYFPYKTREDMNPSLRGIDPPITPEQGEEIARQAESIGADKGGWGIAIDSWKKRHEVKDGHWIVKPKEKEVNNSVGDKTEEETPKQEMAVEETPKEETKPESENKEMATETPTEEKQEDVEEKQEDQEEEDEKEEMSFDFSVAKAIFEGAEGSDALFAEFCKPFAEVNYSLVLNAFCQKMSQLNEACKNYACEKETMSQKMSEMEQGCQAHMAELENLKKFKSDKEQEEFNFAIDAILKDIESRVEIPVETLTELKEKAKEFSLDNIDAFSNLAKATGFGFALKTGKEENGILRIALNNPPKKTIKSDGNLLW